MRLTRLRRCAGSNLSPSVRSFGYLRSLVRLWRPFGRLVTKFWCERRWPPEVPRNARRGSRLARGSRRGPSPGGLGVSKVSPKWIRRRCRTIRRLLTRRPRVASAVAGEGKLGRPSPSPRRQTLPTARAPARSAVRAPASPCRRRSSHPGRRSGSRALRAALPKQLLMSCQLSITQTFPAGSIARSVCICRPPPT